MAMRAALPSIILLLLTSSAGGQSAQDVDAIVKELFPKYAQMQDMRYGEIAVRLGLHPGSNVADVGCGQGEAALVWSRVVGPTGHVWAEDIDARQLKAARKLMKAHSARNVTVERGEVADPHLPPGKLDGITLFYVYHELVKYPEMLARFHDALKPEGRLVILDPLARKTATRPREVQAKNHVLMPSLAEAELQIAGFKILSRDDHFVDNPDSEVIDWLIVARPVHLQ